MQILLLALQILAHRRANQKALLGKMQLLNDRSIQRWHLINSKPFQQRMITTITQRLAIFSFMSL
ncbi:MAG: hypothetical protein LH702_30515 [Phormidesmis sp. CAN_BIN44]|nr:hypothetical protein [Phormidesmis sp. CAN_BIN44]